VPADEDTDDDAEAHAARMEQAESVLRERRARVRICAWCESVGFEGTWYPKASPLTFVWRVDPRASHTICPACFAEMLPDVPYPES
jgi:hypothetical protein